MERRFDSGKVLKLIQGDITTVVADAIANAANSPLRGGGGVDGAIHRAGGPEIMRELGRIRRRIGRCPAGGAVVTGAGNLPARFVFHAVGPIYRDGHHGEPESLASCYHTCMQLATERKVRTITFPSISTGVYGYPLREAAPIAVGTVSEHLKGETSVEEATFVLFDKTTFEAYTRALSLL